jgi:hypothetical protein
MYSLSMMVMVIFILINLIIIIGVWLIKRMVHLLGKRILVWVLLWVLIIIRDIGKKGLLIRVN